MLRLRFIAAQRGTGQTREKVKEDENGIGIAGARSLSSEAGEGAGGSKQTRRILNHESFRQNKARQAPLGLLPCCCGGAVKSKAGDGPAWRLVVQRVRASDI